MKWLPPRLSPQLRDQAIRFLDDPQAPQTMSTDLFMELIVERHLVNLAERFDDLRPIEDHPNRRMYIERLTEANGSIAMYAEARHLDQEIDVIAIRIVWKFEG